MPFLLLVLVVSVTQFSLLTALIPLLVVAATAYFLPFGLGNTHVTRLVRSLNPAAAQGGEGFIVQLTLSPRLRSGLRALLEDADKRHRLPHRSFGGDELSSRVTPSSCPSHWTISKWCAAAKHRLTGPLRLWPAYPTCRPGLDSSRITRIRRALLLAAAHLAGHSQQAEPAPFHS